MADAIILSRVPSGPTTAELQVQFIGADLLANPTYAHVAVTVDYAAHNSAQLMAAFAAAVRDRPRQPRVGPAEPVEGMRRTIR